MKTITRLCLIVFCFVACPTLLIGQGKAAHFLLGYDYLLADTNVTSTKANLKFDTSGVHLTPASFKMPFRASQGTLSDENGNLLMVTNGCWIADATGDTMQNGGGLLPSGFASTWCDQRSANPLPQTSVFLPHPNDTNFVYLIHQSGSGSSSVKSTGLYYSLVDRRLHNGLGGVVTGQKNQPAFLTGLNPGIAVCRNSNGRDWWIVTLKDSSSNLLMTSLSPAGFSSPNTIPIGFAPTPVNLIGQMYFSPDGKKFAYVFYQGIWGAVTYYIRIFDFDRCSGTFSNAKQVTFQDTSPGLGLCFSPNSKELYVSSIRKIIQLNVDTTNIAASMDTVAINDGYYSPYPPFQSDFWVMTLAANGKIYLSSGNSVIDLHYINVPDSDGVACDIRQHALHLPSFSIRGQVFHPNYYLGCDTTSGCPCLVSTGISEYGNHDFSVKLSPNPGQTGFEILYLLPQNKEGLLTIYDMQGRCIQKQNLPPWSTMQSISAVAWAPGVYQVHIESEHESGTWKWVKY